MHIKLSPYISFKNNAKEAMEFYKSIFGGDLKIQTFKEFEASTNPAEDNLVMHSSIESETGVSFMASDTPDRMTYNPGNNISMSLSGEDEALLKRYFEKLAEGGNISMPLEKAMWGDIFGMLTDKYGINWLVNITASKVQD